VNFNNVPVGSNQRERLIESSTKLFGKPGFSDGPEPGSS
jgi:hypothetical protein